MAGFEDDGGELIAGHHQADGRLQARQPCFDGVQAVARGLLLRAVLVDVVTVCLAAVIVYLPLKADFAFDGPALVTQPDKAEVGVGVFNEVFGDGCAD